MLRIIRSWIAPFRNLVERVGWVRPGDPVTFGLKQGTHRLICGLLLASGAAFAQVPPEDEYVADSTFGTAGRFRHGFAGTISDVGSVVVPTAGTYWVIGYAYQGIPGAETFRLTLSRLSAAGVPITSFGVNGHLLTTIEGVPNGSAFVDSQGRLIVSVRVIDSQSQVQDSVVRILATGAQDWQWIARDSQGSNLFIADIAPASGDAVWVSKQQQVEFINADVVRVTSSGVLDASFAPFGSAQMGPFTPLFGGALVRDAQGRIWWAPDAASAQGRNQLVVRLTAAGALDTTYSGDGIAVLPTNCNLGTRDNAVTNLAVLPGNSAVVRFDIAASEASGIVAALPDGTAGPLRCEDSTGPVTASAGLAARDASSFFAASRHCLPGGACGPTLRRFLVQANGAIVEDPQFSVDTATQTFPASSTPEGSAADVIVDQGKPVIVGSTARANGTLDRVVIRYGGRNALFQNGFE